MKNTSLFKNYLYSDELCFVMEAHNGISAKIVEKAGFKAIWASGLSIATSLGVRDCNELSSHEIVNILSYMTNSVNIPIVVDGDTGFGNYNNFRRFVKQIEQIGVSAVCIEDKVFPKTNSFIDRNQQLADVEEFCGKIKAGKDTARDSDFCIIARTESFIAGFGLDEALRRAEAYRQAGADAILIHSGKNDAEEIVSFAKNWNNKCPTVIVPTKYYQTPTSVFKEHKISMVIWANHALRSSISAMEQCCKFIIENQSIAQIENTISSLQNIFNYVNMQELEIADKQYLSK